jgi:hypothetical protein
LELSLQEVVRNHFRVFFTMQLKQDLCLSLNEPKSLLVFLGLLGCKILLEQHLSLILEVFLDLLRASFAFRLICHILLPKFLGNIQVFGADIWLLDLYS